MTLELLALNIHTTGLTFDSGCHSDGCVIGKPPEAFMADESVESHQAKEG